MHVHYVYLAFQYFEKVMRGIKFPLNVQLYVLYRVSPPQKKEHPTSLRYFISVYNELLQKIHIDDLALALGLGVIRAKDG